MWRGARVSVVFPTYNERESIRAAIRDFFATGFVDEVVVVNNNAAPGTSEEVAGTGAREVLEPRQGYGHAIQRGLREATGDLLVVAEPDGTFAARDVLKLLAYADEFDYVVGTRTTHEYIWDGANMDFWLKWGNVAVAKLVEVLFSASILTDCGCTLRLIHRDAYERVRDRFSIGGSHFGLEMTLVCLTSDVSMTEIPVNYGPRVGQSMVTGDRVKAIRLGATMAAMVLRRALVDKVLHRRRRLPSTARRPLPSVPLTFPGPRDAAGARQAPAPVARGEVARGEA